MNYHENRRNDKGNHADDSGWGGANEGIASVGCEVDTDGANAVNRTMSQNCRNTTLGFQGHIGHETTKNNTKDAHHTNSCKG